MKKKITKEAIALMVGIVCGTYAAMLSPLLVLLLMGVVAILKFGVRVLPHYDIAVVTGLAIGMAVAHYAGVEAARLIGY